MRARIYAIAILLGVSTLAIAANPIGPVNVPSMPGYVVDVTPSDTDTFPPSVIIIADADGGSVTLTPSSPAGGADIVWTTATANFIVPGLYRAVKEASTATDIKRIQINE